jgi:protein-tyrosine-phosphatase
VESFGTLPLGPAPVLPEARELGLSCGVDVSEHRARLVGTTSLEQVDLVIGFEQHHVRQAVIDAAAAVERSFSFREIVALLEDAQTDVAADVATRARDLVAKAAELRAKSADARFADGVRDPFGRSWRVYRETAVEVRELSLRLVGRLFGVADATGLPALPAKLPRRPRRSR